MKDIIYNQVLPPLITGIGVLLVTLVTWVTLWVRQKIGQLKLEMWGQISRDGSIYADERKRDPNDNTVITGVQAHAAAMEFAKHAAKVANLGEPPQDTRAMFSIAEHGKLKKGITGAPTLHAETVTIATSQPPPAPVDEVSP